MERLTVDKPVKEMEMYELAHNSCFIKNNEAYYRDYDGEISARNLAKKIASKWSDVIYIQDEFFTDDDFFDEKMMDWLMYDVTDMLGILALFYRNLWAMAELYETLKHYEDSE